LHASRRKLRPALGIQYDRAMLAVVGNVIVTLVTVALFAATIYGRRI
jgi:hypothetical protein